jgi:tetratricopeptide (TPR) repeat protein
MELAREANDVGLLMRCYINLGAILASFGDERRAIALLEEGLERARRSSSRQPVFWIANNLASSFAELGRLTEAVPLHQEAMAAGEAVGLARAGQPEYAWTLLQLGRVEEARETWLAAKRGEGEPEPQMIAWWAINDALMTWADDPQQSIKRLSAGIGEARDAGAPDNVAYVAGLLTRMAMRAGDAEALRLADAAVRETAALFATPLAATRATWYTALADPNRTAGAAQAARAAEELASIGRRRDAADAYADATWLAERAGLPTDEWRRRADELYAECSAVPLLDWLPTRVTA